MSSLSIPTTLGAGYADIGDPAQMVTNMSLQQYYDYVSRFVPIENQLIQYATDPTQMTQAATQAQGYVDAAFNNQPGALQRGLLRQGITMTPQQQAAVQQQANYQRGLAEVGAMNTAAQATNAAQMSALGATAVPNIAGSAAQQQLGLRG